MNTNFLRVPYVPSCFLVFAEVFLTSFLNWKRKRYFTLFKDSDVISRGNTSLDVILVWMYMYVSNNFSMVWAPYSIINGSVTNWFTDHLWEALFHVIGSISEDHQTKEKNPCLGNLEVFGVVADKNTVCIHTHI